MDEEMKFKDKIPRNSKFVGWDEEEGPEKNKEKKINK